MQTASIPPAQTTTLVDRAITQRIVATANYAYVVPAPIPVDTRQSWNRWRDAKKQNARPLPVKAPDLTPAEKLDADYERFNTIRWNHAQLQNERYEIRAYDPDTDTVYLQERSIKTNEVYEVNRHALTCTCPDAKGTVANTNLRLNEANANKRIFCKHQLMINLRETTLDWVEFERGLAALGQMFHAVGKEAAIAVAVDRAFAGRDELNAASISREVQTARDFD